MTVGSKNAKAKHPTDAKSVTKTNKGKPKPKKDAKKEQQETTATTHSSKENKKQRKTKTHHKKKDTKEVKQATTVEELPDAIPTAATVTNTVSTIATLPAGPPPPVLTMPIAVTPLVKNQGSCRKAKCEVKPTTSNPEPAATTPAPPPPTITWAPETVAKSWLEKADFAKTKQEFEKLPMVVLNVVKDCKKWKANAKWNQTQDYPAYDATLVKTEEYVNMSHVEVYVGKSMMMGQLPVKNGEDSFWKAVFEKRISHIVVIVEDPSQAEFFPQKAEEYKQFGQMWINNRRVEKLHEQVNRFCIEVLPNGCSNSLVTTVTVIRNWPQDVVHATSNVVAKVVNELNLFLDGPTTEEAALIISQNGVGRSGFFLALTVAIRQLEAKTEPNIADIVKTIRNQRAKALESFNQYVGLYQGLFYYIKIKAGVQNVLGIKAKEMSDRYVEAMIADAAQKSQMGTTTMTTTTTLPVAYTPPAQK